MKEQRFFRIWLLLCLLFSASGQGSSLIFNTADNGQFASIDQAFSFDFQQKGSQLQLNWQIRPGYYLYRQKIDISANHAQLAAFVLPPGQQHHDDNFGDSEVYAQHLALLVPIREADAHASVTVSYQGCAAAGFCYPPQTREIPLSAVIPPPPLTSPTALQTTTVTPEVPFSLWWALLFGIAIAFTPCVLPMYPLITTIIIGKQGKQTTRRTLALALAYTQGMTLSYTLLGLLVAALGLRFQAMLQSPWLLLPLCALFILLALAMFGCYQLQLPSTLQTSLTLWSNRQKSGSLPGVFVMGVLAGLICTPCTTAPLSAILLYVAQSSDLALGALSLYLYALGIGIPLILITLFGQRLLPRSGAWMVLIKQAMGFAILAMPIFLLERLVGDIWGLRLWSLLGIAVCGWVLQSTLHVRHGAIRIMQLLFFVTALILSRPLQEWIYPSNTLPTAYTGLVFQKINNQQELQHAIQQARGKRIMLDIYADWCVACQALAKTTFRAASIQQQLAETQLLQVDISGNTPEQQALLAKLQVLGLPSILFFDPQGNELTGARVNGYQDVQQFSEHLQNVLQ